jgi:hypothetical protein
MDYRYNSLNNDFNLKRAVINGLAATMKGCLRIKFFCSIEAIL